MQEPNYKAACETLTIVQSLFEGGLTQFLADGGEFCCLPLPEGPEEFYIYHPQPMPQKIQEALTRFGDSMGVKYCFVQTRNFNPDEYPTESVADTLRESLNKSKAAQQAITLQLNIFAGLMVVMCDTEANNPIALDLMQCITQVPGVVRVFFAFKDGYVRYEAPAVEAPKLQATVTPEVSKLDHPIGDSEVADVKILLNGVETIDDLLAKM